MTLFIQELELAFNVNVEIEKLMLYYNLPFFLCLTLFFVHTRVSVTQVFLVFSRQQFETTFEQCSFDFCIPRRHGIDGNFLLRLTTFKQSLFEDRSRPQTLRFLDRARTLSSRCPSCTKEKSSGVENCSRQHVNDESSMRSSVQVALTTSSSSSSSLRY